MDLKSSISKREKMFFAMTISIITISIFYGFVIEPFFKAYIRLSREINIKQTRLAKNLKLMNEKDIVSNEFKRHSQQLKEKGSDEEEMASVLSEIEIIGKNVGFYLSNVKPQKIKDMDFYKIMFVEIKFQADIQTFSKFIYEIQNSPLLLKVSRLQLNSKGGDSSFLEGTIQISKISLS